MKKLLVLLLLMISTTVFAEWIEVGGSIDGGVTTYADPGTIKRKGHKVVMWDLSDYKTVKEVVGKRSLSLITRAEYDCEEETIRTLDFYYYSGNMRRWGETVASDTNIEMEAHTIIPESMNKSLLNIACSKK